MLVQLRADMAAAGGFVHAQVVNVKRQDVGQDVVPGVPLEDAEGILARFEGTDLIGIVPENCPTRYCESRFPEKYGTILDFIHVDEEDMENFGDQIEWLLEDPAVLIKKGEDGDDGSQTETD